VSQVEKGERERLTACRILHTLLLGASAALGEHVLTPAHTPLRRLRQGVIFRETVWRSKGVGLLSDCNNWVARA
jgi:hypothetical protein